MIYEKFRDVFNNIIFEQSKAHLIKNIADSPNRYIGLFRPTKPKAKILQNLLQSHEIRFGDAFEEVVHKYLAEFGFENLNRKLTVASGDKLELDQCFQSEDKVYFVEQKIRDDHDSTKKRGQISNFEKKIDALSEIYGEKDLVGYFYFVDPELNKNKRYYETKIRELETAYGVKLHLVYGSEFFESIGEKSTWFEILDYLKRWKNEVPDFPEINFDLNPQVSFDELKELELKDFRKIFSNEEIFEQIVMTLFPTGETLRLLLRHFKAKSSERQIYKTLAELIEARLKLY